jgi:hypothetical protein
MVLKEEEIAYLKELEEGATRRTENRQRKRKRNVYARFCLVAVVSASRGILLLTSPDSFIVADLRNAFIEGDLLPQVVLARMALLVTCVTCYLFSVKLKFYPQIVNVCAIVIIAALLWLDAEFILVSLTGGHLLQVYFAVFFRICCIYLLVLNHIDLVRGV